MINNGQCKTLHKPPMDNNVFFEWTPIRYAAKYGYTEIFKCIISKIEKVDNGLALLELATQGNHVEIVGILLKMFEKLFSTDPQAALNSLKSINYAYIG